MAEKRRVSTIKVARTARGMTQFDLAQAAGTTESRISRVETGRQPADEELRRKLANILNIPTYEVA